MEQNLSYYQIFYTVAGCGNISKASRILFTSQPAISKAIQKLETNLGVTLFIRSSRGVTLTNEGNLLYAQVSKAMDALSQGEEQIRQIQEMDIGHLRIGASTTLSKYVLLPLLDTFIKQNPTIQVSIHCQSTFETVRLLNEGKLDIGLTGTVDSTPQMRYEKYMDIQDTFVSTESYLEQLPVSNTHEILNNCNLMLLDEDNISRMYIDQFFQMHNIEINKSTEISTMDLLIEFARIGLGVACVIKEFVLEDIQSGRLLELPLPKQIKKRGIGFTYATNSINQLSVEKFHKMLHTKH